MKPEREITKSPSFKNYNSSSEVASRSLAKNRAVDTKCERLLRSTLWRMGLRFRKNVKSLPGRPDVVFVRQRIAIFCDGDFWHGREWNRRRRKLKRGANSTYWIAKIRANIDRDKMHTKHLCQLGWTVIRLWETDILSDAEGAAAYVRREVIQRSKQLDQ
jgi:DNA mismatch endonuclease (patch repair protein)